MRLCTFEHSGKNHAGVAIDAHVVPIDEINARRGTRFPDDLLTLIQAGLVDELKQSGAAELASHALPLEAVKLRLPYPAPPKIWCIGLNYLSHAEDLQAKQPEEPGSFMKPSSSLMEPGGQILLPPAEISNEVDAEGELGVVIGRECRDVPVELAGEVILGYTTTLDMTALDVLRRNTRYLTRAKSFDTFFSFGPVIVTADEVADVDAVEVITEHNGAVFSRDYVRHMRARPYELVSFHSRVFTWQPGDVLSTGCPKGARIQPGDRVAARLTGIGSLEASVSRRQARVYIAGRNYK
ncbi:MAG TPA: fumarylacetoacetate hydrolase family protein [Bryobacterales bacterium]|nr:fumarylacetoacetate hydrolase family protein [Bryobacterales bacterium]